MDSEMKKAIEAYPLSWPAGRPRTTDPQFSRFGRRSWNAGSYGHNSLTNGRARDAIVAELDSLGATNVIISTNMPVRNDGVFYASAKEPDDSGVAVYFQLKGKSMVFACDQWRTVKENAWAIAKTIEAIRGIERWGSGDMLERAFTGFQALPVPETKKHWTEVLGVPSDATCAQIEAARDRLALKHHPDRGGSHDKMAEINRAYDEAWRGGLSA